MMVIDTVHSSGVGRMHGHTGRMKITRPQHSFQGSEAKRSILSTSPEADKKGTSNLDRPGLVIRRRIMVRQSDEPDEPDDARFYRHTPALPNQPKPSTTTTVNHPLQKMDHTARHCDTALARSFPSPQDQVCKTTAPMTKPPKTLRLFDLNKLPTSPTDLAPISSPTSTIDSADSTTHVTTDALRSSAVMADTDVKFSSSPPSTKILRDEGDARRGGAKLAVDLGLLPPSLETSRHKVEDSSLQLKIQVVEVDAVRWSDPDLPTPARKRLRKLSEYAGGHGSAASLAKSWTTGVDDGCTHLDVTKTLAASPQADAKVCRHDVDDEVFGAVSALVMLKKCRRDFAFSSMAASSLNGSSSLGGTHMDEEVERREAGPASDTAASETTSARSLGSGGSVLLRPSNKQRYRSMAELMAQTPILRRV